MSAGRVAHTQQRLRIDGRFTYTLLLLVGRAGDGDKSASVFDSGQAITRLFRFSGLTKANSNCSYGDQRIERVGLAEGSSMPLFATLGEKIT